MLLPESLPRCTLCFSGANSLVQNFYCLSQFFPAALPTLKVSQIYHLMHCVAILNSHGQMAHLLRAGTCAAEDPGSMPSTHLCLA